MIVQFFRLLNSFAATFFVVASIALADDVRTKVYLAEGVKVGEVTATDAVLWTRLCAAAECDKAFRLPGATGEVRFRYHAPGEPNSTTVWRSVDPTRDYTLQCAINGLRPATTYTYTAEARNDLTTATFEGRFRTAPAADQSAQVNFVVTTGHKHATAEEPDLGPRIYPSMLATDPDFFVHTGDVVYYDNDTKPNATTAKLARLHWHRLYSLPRRIALHRQVSSYFMKDDHDLLADDCWPGQTFGLLTFREGVSLFNEQVPSGPLPYRSFRWGTHLQVWLVEGREFRSPNNVPDGPDKTIWGADQLAWLRKEMASSDATFRLLITPTPIVGPDRPNKHDNHSNDNFAYEGDQVRNLLAELDNTYVLCGDRHWQYVAVDETTGLREYSCGSSTDAHSGGWGKNDKRAEHEFLRVAGGFLSVAVVPRKVPSITFRLHDVAGVVVYEETRDSDE